MRDPCSQEDFNYGKKIVVNGEVTSANSDISPAVRNSRFQKKTARRDFKHYNFCRYSTISGLVQFIAKTNLRRTMPLRSMMVVSG